MSLAAETLGFPVRWPNPPAIRPGDLRLGARLDLVVDGSSLPPCRPGEETKLWLNLRVPLLRDAAGNLGAAKESWRLSVSSRLSGESVAAVRCDQPMEVDI